MGAGKSPTKQLPGGVSQVGPSSKLIASKPTRICWVGLRRGSEALMAEGLNPIEAGKKLHEHGEAAQQRAEKEGGHGSSEDRHSRIIQIGEAVLLALVTLAAAWAGYSAARWSTESRVDIAQSSRLGNLATRNDLLAISLRDFDSSTFNAWFIAFTLNSPEKEAIAVRRFRPQFLVAFNAWMATNPLHNPHAPPGPTYMPQYRLSEQEQADALDNAATAKFQTGNQAGQTSDDYVRITVLLAVVLFLVGIGTSFKLKSVRYALIAFGSVLLIVSVVLILQQPGLPS
jgi:hypothetical protein